MSKRSMTLLVLVVTAVLVQLYPVERRNRTVSSEVTAPSAVRRVLERSCYDCHSNETRWPWYAKVAPTSWLVARDVRRARSAVNFSEWPPLPREVDCGFTRHLVERVAEDEMPPLRYRLLHPAASVSAEELALLREWALERCDAVQ